LEKKEEILNRMKMQDPHRTHIVREHCKKQKRKQREKSGGLLKRETRDLRTPHTPSHLRNKSFNFRVKEKGVYLKTKKKENSRTKLGCVKAEKKEGSFIWECCFEGKGEFFS